MVALDMPKANRKSTRTGREKNRTLSAEDAARMEASQLREIESLQMAGMTWDEAMREVGHLLPHSTLRKRLEKLHENGAQGLMDQRHPPEAVFTEAMRGFAIGLRRSWPAMPTKEIEQKLKEAFGWTGSIRRLETVLKEAGLAHPRGAPHRRDRKEEGKKPGLEAEGPISSNQSVESHVPAVSEPILEEQELGGAGLTLLKLMDELTGYSRAMAEQIQELALAVPEPAIPIPVDRSHRDERGHFLSEYNAPKPRTDPAVGAVFDSVESKRQGKDLTRLSLRKISLENIQAKILALMALPVVSESGRFDGVTEPRGEWLESLGGHDFMPETLMKFARELKYLGVSSPLIELHASFWYRELSPSLGEEASQLILYVDATDKPYWTEFFHKSGRVATVGRVMPCLETILIHTGAGVPLYLRTFAGHVSLVKHLLPMLHEMETAIGEGMLGRITVVDGEMNCVALFKEFDKDRDREGRSRLFITSLDSPQVADLSRIQSRTAWMPYRNGDRIAGGFIDLVDSHDKKAPLYRARVILLERRGKKTISGYATNAPFVGNEAGEREGFENSQVLDIYFRRWPAQELVFRDLNKAVHFKEIHGYGKQKVVNLTVVDQLETLAVQTERAQARLEKHQEAAGVTASELAATGKALRQTTQKLQRAENTPHLVLTLTTPKGTQKAILQDQATVGLEREREEIEEKHDQLEEQIQEQTTKIERLQSRIQALSVEREQLEDRRLIYQTDVELDQILSVFKLGFALLFQALLQRFFGALPIEFNRFLVNIFALRGRRVVTPTTETFYLRGNRRNPDLMQELKQACVKINALGHQRDGRRVRVEVSWPPE